MIFLDSNVIIDFIQSNQTFLKFLVDHQNERFAIASPSLFEIYYGFEYVKSAKKFRTEKKFLQRIKEEELRLKQILVDIDVFSITNASIQLAAKIAAGLDATGQEIDQFDSLIAAVILSNGYSKILTGNFKYFTRIDGIEVLNY